MRAPGAHPPRWVPWVAIGASAVIVTGCWQPRPRPTTTTSTTTTATIAPATTTTTVGHGHPDPGEPGDDKGWSKLRLGHEHEQGEVPVDAATAAEVARQLAITQELVAKYRPWPQRRSPATGAAARSRPAWARTS